MAHDFAKQRSSDSQSRKKRSANNSATKVSQTNGHWPWFFSGLLSGLFVAFIGFFWLYRSGPLQNLNNSVLAQDAVTEADAEAGAGFTFYDRLSEAEVLVDVVAVELQPQVEVNPSIYRVQAASFNTMNDAERLKAEIILMGLNAAIYQAEVLGQTVYRVQAGPFVGNTSAEDAIDLLARNSINGAIKIEVR
tara:strand:- start:10704 stop:11279 length:576 start_codon:yes stop_codon:yes gene_type:complete